MSDYKALLAEINDVKSMMVDLTKIVKSKNATWINAVEVKELYDIRPWQLKKLRDTGYLDMRCYKKSGNSLVYKQIEIQRIFNKIINREIKLIKKGNDVQLIRLKK